MRGRSFAFHASGKRNGYCTTGETFLTPERISKCLEHKTKFDVEAADPSIRKCVDKMCILLSCPLNDLLISLAPPSYLSLTPR